MTAASPPAEADVATLLSGTAAAGSQDRREAGQCDAGRGGSLRRRGGCTPDALSGATVEPSAGPPRGIGCVGPLSYPGYGARANSGLVAGSSLHWVDGDQRRHPQRGHRGPRGPRQDHPGRRHVLQSAAFRQPGGRGAACLMDLECEKGITLIFSPRTRRRSRRYQDQYRRHARALRIRVALLSARLRWSMASYSWWTPPKAPCRRPGLCCARRSKLRLPVVGQQG